MIARIPRAGNLAVALRNPNCCTMQRRPDISSPVHHHVDYISLWRKLSYAVQEMTRGVATNCSSVQYDGALFA